MTSVDLKMPKTFNDIKISTESIWFRYEKNLPDVVTGVNFTAHSGELFVFLAETEPEKLLFSN